MNTQEIIQKYLDGESLAGLSRLTNKTTYILKKLLQENHVHIRSRHEQNVITNKKRTKFVDDTYFSNITTYNQAWLLGFLAADGTIKKDRNEIKIGLSSVDKEILEKIKNELQIERKIFDYTTENGFNISELKWSSEQQKKDLAKFSIIPNKTYFPMALPKLMNNNLILAFILGYFDGDGSFSVQSNGKYARLRICAHRNELLQEIADFLQNIYHCSYSLSQDNRKLWELSISTKYSIQILQDMYNLNSICLNRKKQKYLEYINHETMTS